MAYPVPTNVPYKEAFKQAVLAANPDRPDVNKLVNDGNLGQLGMALRSNVESSRITNTEIMDLLQNGRSDDLLEMAKKHAKHVEALVLWQEYNRIHNPGPCSCRYP